MPRPQFGKYLEEKARPEWRNHYLDYKALKDLIKESATEDAAVRLCIILFFFGSRMPFFKYSNRRRCSELRGPAGGCCQGGALLR